MKLSVKLFVLSFVLLLFACNNKEYKEDALAADINYESEISSPSNQSSVDRKLIKEAEIRFEVAKLDEYKSKLLQNIKKFNGYIASDTENNYAYAFQNDIIIKIPADRFDSFLSIITKGIENVDHKEITVKDVTEEFVDIKARLQTKKELESRYLEILQKANKVSEILDIERQIGEIREEIEVVEGRLKYLENQIAFASIALQVYENKPEELSSKYNFGGNFIQGWDNLVGFVSFLIKLWPFLIIIIITIFLFKRLRKKKKLKL